MASPEFEQNINNAPEAIQKVQEGFGVEQEKRLNEHGLEVRPHAMQNIQDDQGQVIAQSTDPAASVSDDTPQITIPVNEDTAQSWSKGNIKDSQTWLGVQVLRNIKMALHNSWKLVIGKN